MSLLLAHMCDACGAVRRALSLVRPVSAPTRTATAQNVFATPALSCEVNDPSLRVRLAVEDVL